MLYLDYNCMYVLDVFYGVFFMIIKKIFGFGLLSLKFGDDSELDLDSGLNGEGW